MRRFEGGEALAKEMGIKPETLKATCACFYYIVTLTHPMNS